MILILFADGTRLGDYLQCHGWSGVWWLARRHPRLLFSIAGASLVQRLGGSPSHVIVEHGGAAVDYGFTETRFLPALGVTSIRYVVAAVAVHGTTDLTRWEGRRDGGWAATLWVTLCYLILYASRGRIRLRRDCIAVAKACLLDAGIEVPHRVWTVPQLMEHLHAIGCAAASPPGIGGPTPR